MRGLTAVALGLGLGGCLTVNGAFQAGEDGGGSGTGASSSGVETTSSGTTEALTSEGSSTGPDPCAGDPADLCVAQEIGGQSYLICERIETWEQARLTCEARCARLAIVDEPESAAIFAWLRDQMSAEDMVQDTSGADQVTMQRASWWLGGHKVAGVYQWLDGTPMPPTSTGGWAPTNPDMAGDDGCVVLGVFAKAAENGKWFDRSCIDVPYRSICEPL